MGEFTAYCILFAAAVSAEALAYELKELLHEQWGRDRFIGHALQTCRAYNAGNYVSFLRLYASAPRMAPFLMDRMLVKLRKRVYAAALCAYSQQVLPLSALQRWWGFETTMEMAAFIKDQHGVVKNGELDVQQCTRLWQQSNLTVRS